MGDKWKIWFNHFDKESGEFLGGGVLIKEYTRKGNAIRAARRWFGSKEEFKWIVSKENPFINYEKEK